VPLRSAAECLGGFALQATVGYHINDTRAASNGSVRFTRIPIDLLALYSVTDKVRLGGAAEKFKPSNRGDKIDGSHGGVLFSYYF